MKTSKLGGIPKPKKFFYMQRSNGKFSIFCRWDKKWWYWNSKKQTLLPGYNHFADFDTLVRAKMNLRKHFKNVKFTPWFDSVLVQSFITKFDKRFE